MKNQEFKRLESKVIGLANQMLVVSIEELVDGENLTKLQRKTVDNHIKFAKDRYKRMYGTEWTE